MNINKNSSLYYIATKWGKGHPHDMGNLCLFMRKVFLGIFKIIVFYLLLLLLFLSLTDPILTFFMNLYFDLEFEYFYAKFFYVAGAIIYIVSLALSMGAVIVSSYGSSIEVTRTFAKINHIKKR